MRHATILVFETKKHAMIAAVIVLAAFCLGLILYCLRLHATIKEIKLAQKIRKDESTFTDSQMVNVAHQAGIAELNEGILKNIYHVLNTINVSTSVVTEKVEKLETKSLTKLVTLLKDNENDLANFLEKDERGKKVPHALLQFSEYFSNAYDSLVNEITELSNMVQKLNQIVKAQQAYANVESRVDQVDLSHLIRDAIAMESRLLDEHRIEVEQDLQSVPKVEAPKIKLLQVIVTLLRNGCETMVMHNPAGPWRMIATVQQMESGRVSVQIGDARALQSAEVVDPLASPSDSTTLTRRHFSLYYCANAIQEMRGSFLIFCEAPGHGALMRLEFNPTGITDSSAG